MSQIKQQEILISIYSIDYLLRSKIVDESGNTIKICPVSGKVDMFQTNDPVVLVYFDQNVLNTIPADVAEIDRSGGTVALLLRDKEVEEERRIFERYPVSLAISARRKFSSKRLHLVVKDISLYGMRAVSQAEMDEEEQIDIDLITDRSMFYLSGKVVWKKKLSNCNEYGLQLTNYDVVTKNNYEEFLKKQKDGYYSMLSKAR